MPVKVSVQPVNEINTLLLVEAPEEVQQEVINDVKCDLPRKLLTAMLIAGMNVATLIGVMSEMHLANTEDFIDLGPADIVSLTQMVEKIEGTLSQPHLFAVQMK